MADFPEMVQTIDQIFRGTFNLQDIDSIKEVVIHGPKARGAGYRIRKKLNEENYEIIPVTEHNQKLPEHDNDGKRRVLFLDLRNFRRFPENLRETAKKEENTNLLVVDVEERHKTKPLFSYTLKADFYQEDFEKDIDREIKRAIAELYLNVDYAVDEEGIRFANGKFVKPYFKTSVLIDYPRSRDILEGNLSSVIRKFGPDVVASRDVSGIPPDDDVRMYHSIKPIADKLGLEAVVIERNDGDYLLKKETKKKDKIIMSEANVMGSKILLVEDVAGKGDTKVDLARIINYAGGKVENCVVMLNRNEGAKDRLSREGVNLYSLTDLDTYNMLKKEKITETNL